MLPGPKKIDFVEGQETPPGYTLGTEARKGMVIGGAITFGTLYLLSAAAAASAQDDPALFDQRAPLFAPVVGPFIALGTEQPAATGSLALVVDGAGQAAGLALFIVGLAMPRKVWLRSDLIAVTPIAAPGLAGLGLKGQF